MARLPNWAVESQSGLALHSLHGHNAGAGAERGGNMGEMAGVHNLNVEIHIEEVRMAIPHVDADDIAPGLADDAARLPQNPRRITDGRMETGLREGVPLGLGGPLKIPPKILLLFIGG